MTILEGLNPAQRAAVQTIEGPLLILAGPGSGKTRVITHRVAYLVKTCGVSPKRIMAVTFTNKAAREMRDRLHGLLGRTAQELSLGTFHAICARILRREGKAIGLSSSYVIYDDADQLSLIKRSMQDLNLDPKRYAPKHFVSGISACKSHLITPDDYALRVNSYFEEILQRVYQQYQALLAQSQALDFDDLLMRTYELFDRHPDILRRYQSRYLHLLVDEFQDTNTTQYALAKQIGGKYRNICVVGDPDQSIYSWRYADLRNILSFEKDFPEARVVFLEQNYRSTMNILEAAHKVVSINENRKENRLWTENDAGLPVRIVEAYSEVEEAQYVVNEIANLMQRGEAQPVDCAVMYRTNAQSRAIEEAFVRYGLPYQLVGSVKFYERREVKDVLAYLRLVHNPYDTVSLMRIINVPPRNIGQRTIDEFTQWTKSLGIGAYAGLETLSNDKSVSPLSARATQALVDFYGMLQDFIRKSREANVVDLLDAILEVSGYKGHALSFPDGEDRWGNLLELRGIASDYQQAGPAESLATFLEGVSLFSDVDELDDRRDAVTLITLHQAKGLEFPIVFIVGVEEGVLPHFKSFEDPAQMEEERRLCYVGMTRAKKRLYMARALRRSLMGGTSANPPSRFLGDIPPHLIESSDFFSESESDEWETAIDQMTYLEEGDHVEHIKFGQGVVVSCTRTRGDYEAVVDFETAGTKRLLLSMAPLRKID